MSYRDSCCFLMYIHGGGVGEYGCGRGRGGLICMRASAVLITDQSIGRVSLAFKLILVRVLMVNASIYLSMRTNLLRSWHTACRHDQCKNNPPAV